MDAVVAAITITALVVAIMSGRVTPLVALVAFPLLAALLNGHGADVGTYVLHGLRDIAPVIAMFTFAILFFGILTDAGLFAPLISRVLAWAGSNPAHIVVATTIVAAIVHLDGAGATTFLITVTAFLPVYDRAGIDRRVLACAVAMAAGVANMLPWGGPTLRAAAALNIPVMELYRPLIPIQLIGFGCALIIAYVLGTREATRLALQSDRAEAAPLATAAAESDAPSRPRMLWVNAALVVAVLGAIIFEWTQPAIAFMVGTLLALAVNYRSVAEQRERIDAHAKSAMMMVTLLLAAGVFTGIMREGGYFAALASATSQYVSPASASHLPALVGVLSMPLSLLFDPDSFYFGILPMLAQVSTELGVPGEQVARGALLGQMTTGFPVSPLTPATYLLVALTRLDVGAHQRFAIPYLFTISLVMTASCVIFGVFPL